MLATDEGSLAKLPLTMFQNGPWCGGGDNEFDADLLRIRKVRVTLRMQAASPTLRGTDANLFMQSRQVPGRQSPRAGLHGALRNHAAQPESHPLRPPMFTRFRSRLGNEQGTALVIALMSMMLLTALGAAVVMVTNTETMIAEQPSQQPGSGLCRRRRGRACRAGPAHGAAVERRARGNGAVIVHRRRDSGEQDAARRRHHSALLRHEHRDRAAAGGH